MADEEYEYPSSGVHPLLEGPTDPRGGFTDHLEAHLIAMVDNGACFDIESGELGYKIARDYGATGFGVGGGDGGAP